MNRKVLKIKWAVAAICAGALSSSLFAQSDSGSTNDALSLLLEQNQQLRTELQALRGMIEEQGFEVRKLQRDSLSRYTNIDDRLTALESAAISNPTAPTLGSSLPPAAGNSTSPDASPTYTPPASASGSVSNPASNQSLARAALGIEPEPSNGISGTASPRSIGGGRGTLQPAVLSEQQLYQMAYDSVINSNFERSIAEFDQYLSIYPDGRFVTNAHYWKGQAYQYLDRFAEARDSYEIILDQYPDAAKLPDAMYGLSGAYQGLGNLQRARQLLNDIKRRFPNTGAANLADARLLTLD